jgi:hypothetical protein
LARPSTFENLRDLEKGIYGKGQPFVFPEFRSVMGQVLIRKMAAIAQQRALIREGETLPDEFWDSLADKLKDYCQLNFDGS